MRRWLAGLLALTFVFDVLATGSDYRDASFVPVLLSLPLAACALFAERRPLTMALTGCGVLAGGSVLLVLAGQRAAYGFGLATFQMTDVVAGAALVGYLVWRSSVETAVWGTLALVVSTVTAVAVRSVSLPFFDQRDWFYAGVAGLAILLVAVGVGLYLRRSTAERDPARRQFFRRQWPLAAVLTMVLFLDLVAALDSVADSPLAVSFLLPVGGAAISAVCAYFGPRHPARMAAISAVATVITAWLTLPAVLALRYEPKLVVPVTTIAAHMALVAYVIRYADRRTAALSVAALVAADLLALGPSMTLHTDHGLLQDLRDYLLLGGLLLVVSAATGQYFRARDRDRSQTVRTAVTGAQQAERMALARELHDVVAHHVTGIVVAAQAARLVADRDPDAAGTALARIENSGTEALTAMRRLVASMRGAAPAGSSAATEQATSDLRADLTAVVDSVTGPTAELTVELPGELPQEVGRSVLRIVQESLTNVHKHAAGARTVRVSVTTEDDAVTVSVVDDGVAEVDGAAPAGGSGGYGLIGMRERVDLLGGRFDAGRDAGGGWTVRAWLPLGKGDR